MFQLNILSGSYNLDIMVVKRRNHKDGKENTGLKTRYSVEEKELKRELYCRVTESVTG